MLNNLKNLLGVKKQELTDLFGVAENKIESLLGIVANSTPAVVEQTPKENVNKYLFSSNSKKMVFPVNKELPVIQKNIETAKRETFSLEPVFKNDLGETTLSNREIKGKTNQELAQYAGLKVLSNNVMGFVNPAANENQLTTKLLKKLEGRTEVSKQFISDLTNSPELKQVEKDITRKILDSFSKGKIKVQDFANKVKAELLPLTVKKSSHPSFSSNKYENIVLPDDIRGNVKDYGERIYESPIQTSAGGVHFSENTKNYFGHTRIEDMAGNQTRRVIEVQSDLYQKGNLERDYKLEEGQFTDLTKKNRPQGQTEQYYSTPEGQAIRKTDKEFKQIQKLQQYNDPTAHFRMVREEVKQAAKDGKTKLQFPTGETAMKIEGLGEQGKWKVFSNDGELEDIENLANGLEIYKEGEGTWIITDVLGDGKFKAVPKERWDAIEKIGSMYSSWKRAKELESVTETFDISGKVDTNNPIYKFYEKDLGRYLKNNYNAKNIIDENGVKWMEVDIKPEHNAPVEAFGLGGIGLGGFGKSLKDFLFPKTPEAGGDADQELIDKQTPITEVKFKDNKIISTNQISNQEYQSLLKREELFNKAKEENKKILPADIESYIKNIKVNLDTNGQLRKWGNTLAIENNNPANLIYAGQPGATKGRGGFAKFKTPELGFRAAVKQVEADQKRSLTLKDFIYKYSPPHENDTAKYLNYLENTLGITKKDKINTLDPIEIAKAVVWFESQTKVQEL